MSSATREYVVSVFVPTRSFESANILRRFVVGFPFLCVFVMGSFFTANHFWSQWWFYAGVVVFSSAVVFEPLYAGSRARFANALGALSSLWAVERSFLEPLWLIYLAAVALFFTASLVLILAPRRSKASRISKLLSRPATARGLGLVLLLLEATGQILLLNLEFGFLAVASVVLYVGAVVTSMKGLRIRRPRRTSIVDVIGPRLALSELPEAFSAGKVRVNQKASAKVVGIMPSPKGLLGILALTTRWDSTAEVYPKAVTIEPSAADSIVGVASPGTSVDQLRFETTEPLELGQVLRVSSYDGKSIYYQITSMRLSSSNWGESKYVTTTVRAAALGEVDGGRLRLFPLLPAPHEAVHLVRSVEGDGITSRNCEECKNPRPYGGSGYYGYGQDLRRCADM
jgi:hypothetical protein